MNELQYNRPVGSYLITIHSCYILPFSLWGSSGGPLLLLPLWSPRHGAACLSGWGPDALSASPWGSAHHTDSPADWLGGTWLSYQPAHHTTPGQKIRWVMWFKFKSLIIIDAWCRCVWCIKGWKRLSMWGLIKWFGFILSNFNIKWA